MQCCLGPLTSCVPAPHSLSIPCSLQDSFIPHLQLAMCTCKHFKYLPHGLRALRPHNSSLRRGVWASTAAAARAAEHHDEAVAEAVYQIAGKAEDIYKGHKELSLVDVIRKSWNSLQIFLIVDTNSEWDIIQLQGICHEPR